MEFKGEQVAESKTPLTGINRIRLEFKVKIAGNFFILKTVLIESDWNLKNLSRVRSRLFRIVLIESDWNLKQEQQEPVPVQAEVLIESDWNLKEFPFGCVIAILDQY